MSGQHSEMRWKSKVEEMKSVHEERIIANTKEFDFVLSDEDMIAIDSIPYCGGMKFDPDSAKS